MQTKKCRPTSAALRSVDVISRQRCCCRGHSSKRLLARPGSARGRGLRAELCLWLGGCDCGVQYVAELERREKEAEVREKEERRRADRQARDTFKELLQTHK